MPFLYKNMGPMALLPTKEDVLRIFITLKSPSPSAGIEPVNLGSSDKRVSHYTTEDDAVWSY
jgi:hypothetical protein